MQIELIETFLDLCETRSFNRTAERLGVAQSTVSGRVRTLERTLDRRLFERGRAGAELTTEGLRFEPHARGLRHDWTEALQATRHGGSAAMTLRVGMQHDLADEHFGDWVRDFRTLLPQAACYFEPDYSAQLSAELARGLLDVAVLFSPQPHPDLHFETLGEVAYRMVSTETERLAEVRGETYVLGNYSPAFARTHAALHPALTTDAAVASGQNAAVSGLVTALGGAGYVLEETAETLARDGLARPVARAPAIRQSVFAAVHLRNRHRATHRRLIGLFRSRFAGAASPRPETKPQRSLA